MGDIKFLLTQGNVRYKKHLETPIDCNKKEVFQKVIAEDSACALFLISLCFLMSSRWGIIFLSPLIKPILKFVIHSGFWNVFFRNPSGITWKFFRTYNTTVKSQTKPLGIFCRWKLSWSENSNKTKRELSILGLLWPFSWFEKCQNWWIYFMYINLFYVHKPEISFCY